MMVDMLHEARPDVDLYINSWLRFSVLYHLRHALDIREHYERKLERANNLYMELSAIMLQLEVREKELMKYVDKHFITVVYWLSLYQYFLLLAVLSGDKYLKSVMF